MILNLFVILFTIVFGFLHKLNKTPTEIDCNRNRKIFVILISIILILQSSLRNVGVGIDTYMYYEMFENDKQLSWADAFHNFILYFTDGVGKDPGYPIFHKFFHFFSGSYRLFLVFIAILFFSSLGRFIYLNTRKLDEVILGYVIYSVMFYSFYSITGLRQTLAMAVCLYSFEFVKKKRLIPFLFCVASVYTIHKTSVFFVPIFFLYHLKNTKLIYTFSLIFFPLIFGMKDYITVAMVTFSGSAYESYQNFEGEKGTYTFTFFIIFLTIITFFFMKKMIVENPMAKPIMNIFAIAVIFTPLTYVNPSMMRIVMYYSIFLIFLIPMLIESFSLISNQLKSISRFVITGLLILLFIKSNSGHEYRFLWQQMDLYKDY